MKKHEGWREGREEYTEVKKVLGVHLNKKHIVSEFLIGNSNGSEWISKKDAIALAQAGILYAILYMQKVVTIYVQNSIKHLLGKWYVNREYAN
jgi:hypothetical protein